ncbi:MAG: DUF302 domain-containing protein [Anaerolineaceae bacterium]|nr:DUF302 domain-containing protein [Anaerolineaceae bacterium]
MEITKTIELYGTVQEVIEKVRSALQMQQFGIISYVNVSEKIEEKTGNHLEPYVILGACNPMLSYQAIQSDERIGILLPCNVVIIQIAHDRCRVLFSNPIPLMNVDPFNNNETIQTVAKQAYEKLILAAEILEEE